MKILITGPEGGSSSIIRDALNFTDHDIQLINFEHLTKDISGYYADLLILNFTDISREDINKIHFIWKALDVLTQPILAFVNGQQDELIKNLQDSGVTQITELPYSHSETRLLIEGYLQNLDLSVIGRRLENPLQGPPKEMKIFEDLSQAVFKKEANASEIFHFFISFMAVFVKKQHHLLFEIDSLSHSTLIHRDNNSGLSVPDSINLSVLFKEENVSRSLEYFGFLSKHPQKQDFFNKHFNVGAKSLLLCPFYFQGKLKYLLLIFSEEIFLLSEEQRAQMETARRFIELKLDHMDLTETLKDFGAKYRQKDFLFFQHIVDQFNFGIIVFNKDLILKYINKEANQLLQLDRVSSGYESLDDILGESNTSAIIKSMQMVEGAYQRPEIEINTPGGQRVLIGFTLTEFVDPLKEEGYILSLKDITYTKELQEEILRMDRLASLGVMASGIAHEIRNPLAGIKAIAQTFEDELSKDDPKNEYVRRIIKQVNRLDELLKSLFSYAKPQKPNRRFFKVKDLMQDVISLLKRKFQTQNIKLVQHYDRDLPAVYVDNAQIQQVIFNLLLNSIEAIDLNGEISVKTTRVDDMKDHFQRKPFIKKITENPYILIVIRDNGCGISSENLQQIFNPFFTTKNFGTGLGLSIVYQIVQENNGIIYYESKEGEGTQCFLFLPAFEPATQKSN